MAHPLKHFITVTRHRHKVIAHCAKAGILWQGLRHDLSKYTPAEFFAGARFYTGRRSPNETEREMYGYSAAWMHHKGRNKHHFEYWVDVDPLSKVQRPVKMPLRYVAEMFCDRVAASKIYKGGSYTNAAPLEYFLLGKGRRFIHAETSDMLEEWLTVLAERGEAEAFGRIRALVNAEKSERKKRHA